MTEFNMIDTKDLQIKSLLEVAKIVGAEPVDVNKLSRGFVNKHNYYPTTFQNLETLIFLHNHKRWKNDVRFVQQVKLQRDKSQPDGVKCQNHMVKLTEKGKELYEHLRSL